MISKRNKAWMETAVELSRCSKHKKSRMSAVIARGKSYMGGGINSDKTHPFIKTHYKGLARGIHAELAALINCCRMTDDVVGTTIYVARTFKNGSIAPNSKPCAGCMRLLVLFGVTTVVFYKDGEVKKERITRNCEGYNSYWSIYSKLRSRMNYETIR